ncbi:unnamed protein product [Prunus armeniaca]
MGDSPPTGTGTGIPRNLLNGDGFGDGGGDGERGRGWYCHIQPLPDPLPSLVRLKNFISLHDRKRKGHNHLVN